MKANLKSPIAWFYIILVGYSIYDYLDHISRSASIFSAHPGSWFLFSFFSLLTLLGVFYIVNYLLDKLFRKHWLAFELLGLFLAISCHILLSGPLFDLLFWPYGQLNFRFRFGPVFVLLSIYFIFRMIWLLISAYLYQRKDI